MARSFEAGARPQRLSPRGAQNIQAGVQRIGCFRERKPLRRVQRVADRLIGHASADHRVDAGRQQARDGMQPAERLTHASSCEQHLSNRIERRLDGTNGARISRIRCAQPSDRRVDTDAVEAREIGAGRGVRVVRVRRPEMNLEGHANAVAHRRAAKAVEPRIVRVAANNVEVAPRDHRLASHLGDDDVVRIVHGRQRHSARNAKVARDAVHRQSSGQDERLRVPRHAAAPKHERGIAIAVEEVGAAQMLVAMRRAGVDARDAHDGHRRGLLRCAAVWEDDRSANVVEAAAHVTVHERNLERHGRVTGIDPELSRLTFLRAGRRGRGKHEDRGRRQPSSHSALLRAVRYANQQKIASATQSAAGMG